MTWLAISRRRLLAVAAVVPVTMQVLGVEAAPIALPVAASLADALRQALATGNPLVVLVSLDGCPFCKIARENYLGPLQRQGLPVVQVDMRSTSMLTGFQGVAQSHDAWVRAMNVKVTPTVLFFGRGGLELVERMAGAYLPDFYGAYLDERLRQARALLAA
jgi:thioredoxin-related protein